MSDQIWKSMRMPKELADKITAIAKKEKRSFAAQALLILENQTKEYDSKTDQAVQLRGLAEAQHGNS